MPTFWFLFELVIYVCKVVNFRGSFYKQLRGMSETIYFVHMYFVAFCSLMLYKGNYHNFKSYFICACCRKNKEKNYTKRGNKKWESILERTVSVVKLERKRVNVKGCQAQLRQSF